MRAAPLLVLLSLSLACSRGGFGSGPAHDTRPGTRPDLLVDLPTDGALIEDAWPDGGACAVGPDPDTVALYPVFSSNGMKLIDTTNRHHGELRGAVGRVNGPPGCGQALSFGGDIADYAELPADPAWDLKEGSIDLWVRIDAPATERHLGIVSRDAKDAARLGHFTLFQLVDGGVAVRLQRGTNDGIARCSPPLTQGDWHHIGVNFGAGGLELFVDGVPAERKDTYVVSLEILKCGTSSEQGIDGNDNPWVLGASSHLSVEGAATPITYPFRGAIDSFRVSRVRRAFGAL